MEMVLRPTPGQFIRRRSSRVVCTGRPTRRGRKKRMSVSSLYGHLKSDPKVGDVAGLQLPKELSSELKCCVLSACLRMRVHSVEWAQRGYTGQANS